MTVLPTCCCCNKEKKCSKCTDEGVIFWGIACCFFLVFCTGSILAALADSMTDDEDVVKEIRTAGLIIMASTFLLAILCMFVACTAGVGSQ